MKSIHGNYLFIELIDRKSTRALLALVLETSMRKRIIKLRGLDNPGVISVSHRNVTCLLTQKLRQSADGTPNSYARKIIWDDGKLVRTNAYTAVYSESDG